MRPSENLRAKFKEGLFFQKAKKWSILLSLVVIKMSLRSPKYYLQIEKGTSGFAPLRRRRTKRPKGPKVDETLMQRGDEVASMKYCKGVTGFMLRTFTLVLNIDGYFTHWSSCSPCLHLLTATIKQTAKSLLPLWVRALGPTSSTWLPLIMTLIRDGLSFT